LKTALILTLCFKDKIGPPGDRELQTVLIFITNFNAGSGRRANQHLRLQLLVIASGEPLICFDNVLKNSNLSNIAIVLLKVKISKKLSALSKNSQR